MNHLFRQPHTLTGFLVIPFMSLILSTGASADEISTCMARLIEQASDSTTVGELRTRCQNQMDSAHEHTEQGDEQQPVEVVDARLEQDEENILRPFSLMAHKPNYFLFGAYNTKGYGAELFQEQYDNPSIEFNDTEAQFQISLKSPLAVDLFDSMDIYVAYTGRSFWQVYTPELSSPFRETNHEPEVWAQFTPNWKFFGFTASAVALGIVHQSNGQGGVLSRSWNRAYANLVFQRGSFALEIKPWFRISEDASDDDNPDITDYLGHYELRAAYKWKENVFSVMSRNQLESGFDRGAFELSWSFPLWNFPYLKGYVQYFNGYGESLIDYNHRVNRLGIGVALTDWL
jgi:phospholipase A1